MKPARAVLIVLGVLVCAGLLAFAVLAPSGTRKVDIVHRVPPAAGAAAPNPAAPPSETIVVAGGCFWGVQGVFAHVKGVQQVVSGYAGGAAATADYETVSTGSSGHAESVQIVFDPRQISAAQVLQIFFSVATDPTQLNHQFPDNGPQYRSVIFYTTPAQASLASAYIAQLNGAGEFSHPVVTVVTPLRGFYPAEDYHQDYLTRHPSDGYIASYDLPKVAALKQLFPEAWRPTPVLALAGR